MQSRRIDESNTGIQAIKYNDGTGIVMVSAEDYRFEDAENGQGIDSIIELLDKPGVISATGGAVYVYQPKYRSAEELRDMIEAAGANVADDVTENIGGTDLIRCDEGLMKYSSLSLCALAKALRMSPATSMYVAGVERRLTPILFWLM